MTLPTMPKVLYAQMWRRIDAAGDDWHPLFPLGGDDVPVVRREPHEPEGADERYEIRVVKYELVMLPGDDDSSQTVAGHTGGDVR